MCVIQTAFNKSIVTVMLNEIERVRDFTVLNRSNYFAIRKTDLSENAEKLLFLLHITIKMPYF